MICIHSIITDISASYYSEFSLHGFVKLFILHGAWKCTLHFALDDVFPDATKPINCENIIDFFNDNLES